MTQSGVRTGRRRDPHRWPLLHAAVLVLAGALAGCAAARPAVPGATASDSLRVPGNVIPERPAGPARGGGFAVTLETQDARLAAALALEATAPTPEHHRLVAAEYDRLGVLDLAYEHLSLSIEQNPHDAAAYDAQARIWRRWGFARLGLPDAYTAARLAPTSAPIANTVGTLLSALGQFRSAREWFAKAVRLDPSAPYAVNNLCYTDVLAGHASAVAECERAVALAPASSVARNNLGLAYAASGRIDLARAAFDAAGVQADAAYNLGVVYLATRQFDRAAKAFAAARAARPQFTLAGQREQQALAAEAGTGRGAAR